VKGLGCMRKGEKGSGIDGIRGIVGFAFCFTEYLEGIEGE
jgi:hypothetical protein